MNLIFRLFKSNSLAYLFKNLNNSLILFFKAFIYTILVLPESVEFAKNGESYVVTITLPDSRVLWAGMEFAYKVYVSASSSDVIVATGIILSVAD